MYTSPKVEKVDSFTVVGFSTRTQNNDEFNPQTAKIANLWQKFFSSDLANNPDIFGVYSNYESDATGFYTVTAGIRSNDLRADLNTVKIQAGNYLVFQGKGEMPNIVVATWKQIWKFFETNPEYKRNYTSDFEAYKSSDEVMIYIGLE